VSKAREWPLGWHMLGPRAVQICKCPTPGTDKVGKCPAVTWGAGGEARVGAGGID